jgi:hypothetical protein
VLFRLFQDVAPASPFIASKERARVTFVVKRRKMRKDEREKQKSGIGRGRLPPYPVGTIFLVAQRCNKR